VFNPFSLLAYGDRVLLGAAAGAAINGFRNSDTPLGDRLVHGAIAGAALGYTAPALFGIGERVLPKVASTTGKGIFSHFTAMPGVYSKLRPSLGRGMAAWKAFGTVPALALAGAGVGYMHSGTLKGAAIGAVAGVGVRVAGGGVEWWNRIGKVPGFRTGLVMGTSAAGVLLGSMAKSDPRGAAEALPDPVGNSEYHPVGTVASRSIFSAYDSGIRDRLNSIGASGDVVFGLHNGRH
jgi:hypothetical protein